LQTKVKFGGDGHSAIRRAIGQLRAAYGLCNIPARFCGIIATWAPILAKYIFSSRGFGSKNAAPSMERSGLCKRRGFHLRRLKFMADRFDLGYGPLGVELKNT